MIYLLLQAEVVGNAVGAGIIRLILTVLGIAGAVMGLGVFLWLVRKLDKKLNK